MEEHIMIADVILKNKQFYILDERGKEISRKWEDELGELIGFSDVFLVFKRRDIFYSYDENFKENAHKWVSELGECKNVVG